MVGVVLTAPERRYMPKQKTVPTVHAMKTYSIKIDPKTMAKAVKLGINTAKIMRAAIDTEIANGEGACLMCGHSPTKAKAKSKK
jgi:hypothetical protein